MSKKQAPDPQAAPDFEMPDFSNIKIPDSLPPKIFAAAVVLDALMLAVYDSLLLGLVGFVAFGLMALLALFVTKNG